MGYANRTERSIAGSYDLERVPALALMIDSDAFICLRFSCSGDDQDLLIAALLDFDVEGFEQTDSELYAFIKNKDWDDSVALKIRKTLLEYGYSTIVSISSIAQQNWHAAWEQGIEPIQAGNFYIHPSWNHAEPQEEGLITIEIDPKMSFGTGHHESTRLLLSLLSEENRPFRSVLDIGTGTGIMSIAAAKMDASDILAIDNDRWSVSNAEENIHRNGVGRPITVKLGSLDAAGEGPFNLIMANINREILLSMLPRFRSLLSPGGRLIMAGLLISDEARMTDALTNNSFDVVKIRTEGEWWSVVAEQGR